MKKVFYYLGAICIFPVWTFSSFVSDNLSELIQWPPLLVMCAATVGFGCVVFLMLLPLVSAQSRPRLAAAISVALSAIYMMNLFRVVLREADLYSHMTLFVVSVTATAAATALAFVLINSIGRLKAFILVGCIMAGIAMAPIVFHFAKLGGAMQSNPSIVATTENANGGMLPNVYFIIIDAYAREDALNKYAGMDNSEFIGQLNSLGFQTLTHARSNYMKTHMSIPSTFAMDYLFLPGETKVQRWNDIWNMMKGDNAVVRKFRQLGYRYVFAGGAQWCSSRTDGCIKPTGIWSRATWQLAHNTPIPGMLSYVFPGLYRTIFSEQWRFDIADVTAQIGNIIRSTPRKPLFFLYHEMAVHDSIYNSDCTLRHDLGAEQIDKIDDAERMSASTRAYSETIDCVNSKLKALLDRLLDYDPDALVVLTSDHGSAFSPHGKIETGASAWTGPEYVDERTAILSSWRLPINCKNDLPNDLSLVNNFRLIFSCITGHRSEMLPNRFFAHDYAPSLEVLEVIPQ